MNPLSKTKRPMWRATVRKACIRACVVPLLITAAAPAWAENPSFKQLTVRFKVYSTPSCQVTNEAGTSDRIAVDFGTSLPMSSIDGSQHEKSIPYQIYCDATSTGTPAGYEQLKLRFAGETAGFGNGLLATDQPNLAIEIRQSGVPLGVGNAYVFDPQYSGGSQYVYAPPFTAVPVRRAGAPLTEGVFRATATLVLDFV